MVLRVAISVLLFSVSTLSPAESGRIIYTYNDASVEKIPIAFISQETPSTDSMCRHRIADAVVTRVAYNESSGMIEGFSASNPTTGIKEKYWNLLTLDLDSRQMVDLSRILQLKTNLIVLYEVCGAADFYYARELWLKSSINAP